MFNLVMMALLTKSDVLFLTLANGRLMPIQKRYYLAFGFSISHENVNLILFSLAKGVDRSWLL